MADRGHGILLAGAVNVPPHAPLTAPQIQYQLADAGVTGCLFPIKTSLEKSAWCVGNLPCCARGVLMRKQPVRIACPGEALCSGPCRTDFVQNELNRRRIGPAGKDLATIMYTSELLATPRGSCLTHANLLSNACAVNESARATLTPFC